MFSLFSLPITVSGVAVANGSIVLTLVGGPATIISTGGAAPSSYTFNLDANGNPPAVMQAWGNFELSPAGTNYTYAVWSGANGTGSTVIGPFTGIIGPSAPYSGTLYPNLTVLPLLSVATINGVTVSGIPSSGQILQATSPTAAAWTSGTGTGNVVMQTNPAFNQAGNVGAAFNLGGGGNSYIDGSSGTLGQGGFIDFTNDASATTGYGIWITNNAFWNGTNWIQPRGVGTSSSGFTASHHKGFSFNRANATGTNGSTFTWTEVANISPTGALTIASVAATGNINSSQTGGGSAAGITGKAVAPFIAFDATGQAADQKWWDLGVNGTQLLGRAVNDANSGSATWLTVNRGAGATIGAITFGAGGGTQTLPTSTGTLARTSGDTFTSTTLSSPVISGTITSYNGTATVGNGVGTVVHSLSLSSAALNQTGTINASAPGGAYLIVLRGSFSLTVVTSPAPFSFTYAGKTIYSASIGVSSSDTFTNTSIHASNDISFYDFIVVTAGTNLTYSATVTGTGNTGTITVDARLIYLG